MESILHQRCFDNNNNNNYYYCSESGMKMYNVNQIIETNNNNNNNHNNNEFNTKNTTSSTTAKTSSTTSNTDNKWKQQQQQVVVTLPKDYKDYLKLTYKEIEKIINIPKSQRAGPRGGVKDPFPMKLYRLLHDIEHNINECHIILWCTNGRSFIIHQPKLFHNIILSRYFDHTQSASFYRQLNLYGFKNILDNGISCYYNPLFLRERPDILDLVFRKETPSNNKKNKKKNNITLSRKRKNFKTLASQNSVTKTTTTTTSCNDIDRNKDFDSYNKNKNKSAASAYHSNDTNFKHSTQELDGTVFSTRFTTTNNTNAMKSPPALPHFHRSSTAEDYNEVYQEQCSSNITATAPSGCFSTEGITKTTRKSPSLNNIIHQQQQKQQRLVSSKHNNGLFHNELEGGFEPVSFATGMDGKTLNMYYDMMMTMCHDNNYSVHPE